MLQHPQAIIPATHWQQQLAQAIRTPEALLTALDLPADRVSHAAAADFPLRVPQAFVARMQKGDWHDPLLRQVLPLDEELKIQEGFNQDPVGDLDAVSGHGILQKYHGRVLVMTTAACGIHCRYCFRRHFPYSEHTTRRTQWQALVDVITADNSISEVILSGGDPLSLDDVALRDLLQKIDAIEHVKRIRIHSRFPIILPSRIDDVFINTIKSINTPIVFVAHCNHANEIDDEVRNALKALHDAHVTLLNQAVLLRGVNDSEEALINLSEGLFESHIMPYYLHLLDRVQGAAHFEVGLAEAIQLMEGIRRKLPGYLVPKLVKEEAGVPYKRPAETLTNYDL